MFHSACPDTPAWAPICSHSMGELKSPKLQPYTSTPYTWPKCVRGMAHTRMPCRTAPAGARTRRRSSAVPAPSSCHREPVASSCALRDAVSGPIRRAPSMS
ncbi:hypothetical protein [Massilia sp. TWP1-3-3]|uniref:hypothetical protein n=1 Tax=Massilia sp. TWP1-3-3 TaxID=2804573 RepID=UPI003CECA60C